MSDKLHGVIFIATLIVFISVVLVAVFHAITGSPEEDRRETRTYGDLICVYNIDEDEIEECR